jgi:hypothetical protein
MASIEITPRELVVRIRGLDKLLAMRTHLSVPLAHVAGVREQAEEAHFDDAVVDSSRGAGIFLRGRVAAGSLQLADGRSFYDVHDPRKAIVIDLEAEPFRHIVVELDDESPAAAARRIRSALGRRLTAQWDAAWSDARREASPSARRDEALPSSPGLPQGVPAWKSVIAIAAGVAFLPVAAIAFVFVAPAMLPVLVLGLPLFGEPRPPRLSWAATPR